MKLFYFLPLLTFSGMLAAASGTLTKDQGPSALAKLTNPSRSGLGLTVEFQDTTAGIMVKVKGEGLSPGSQLGLHVHEKGICEGPDFKSAGEHFNPHQKPHGSPGEDKRHLGDLGNIQADGKGKVSEEFLVTRESQNDFRAMANKAVVLHSKPDDLKTQPSGDSGERIACGVIRL